MVYEFAFENGVAKIREVETGQVIVSQPHNPSGIAAKPWADADEALAWMNIHHGALLNAEVVVSGGEEPVVEEPAPEETPAEETPT